MTWEKTYAHTVLLALDQCCASFLLNRNDITVSTACGLVRIGMDAALQLHPWQHWLLTNIGRALELVDPGHCAGAIVADIARARVTLRLLLGDHP